MRKIRENLPKRVYHLISRGYPPAVRLLAQRGAFADAHPLPRFEVCGAQARMGREAQAGANGVLPPVPRHLHAADVERERVHEDAEAALHDVLQRAPHAREAEEEGLTPKSFPALRRERKDALRFSRAELKEPERVPVLIGAMVTVSLRPYHKGLTLEARGIGTAKRVLSEVRAAVER